MGPFLLKSPHVISCENFNLEPRMGLRFLEQGQLRVSTILMVMLDLPKGLRSSTNFESSKACVVLLIVLDGNLITADLERTHIAKPYPNTCLTSGFSYISDMRTAAGSA